MSSVAARKATQAATQSPAQQPAVKVPTDAKLKSALKTFQGRTWAKSAPAILKDENVVKTIDVSERGASLRTTAYVLRDSRIVYSRGGGIIAGGTTYFGPVNLADATTASKK
jgi:hypothetical protein